MNTEQREAAKESMAAWLAHPQELGKVPAKIECVGDFERHGMRYYMFKYKKSLLSFDWLLGVCGGYEGDSLEHCGHVFSEMEKYDPATAGEKAVAMVEAIREYWMREAERAAAADAAEDAEEAEREGGSFVAFVLLDSIAFDGARFCADLRDEWGIRVPEDAGIAEGEEDREYDGTRFVWEEGGMLASAALMPGPVPDGEAERNAATNYLWPGAVEATKTHVAQILVAVLPHEEDLRAAGSLLVKIVDACLKQKNAIGVYTSGTVFEPGFYREAAAVMRDDELPYLNWIYFGFMRREKGLTAYTFGMNQFGKDEMEVLDSAAEPDELREFLFGIAAYVISSDVTLRDGETLGVSEEERLPITRSEGVCLDGQTLKIAYRPA